MGCYFFLETAKVPSSEVGSHGFLRLTLVHLLLKSPGFMGLSRLTLPSHPSFRACKIQRHS